jgi:hypothetical protein
VAGGHGKCFLEEGIAGGNRRSDVSDLFSGQSTATAGEFQEKISPETCLHRSPGALGSRRQGATAERFKALVLKGKIATPVHYPETSEKALFCGVFFAFRRSAVHLHKTM